MKGSARTLIVLLVGAGFAGSALAAMDSAQTTTDTRATGHMSQKLQDDLTKAEFTDIIIMPSSLLVRAKDSQGNSVVMVINPDSLTEVTEQTKEHHEPPLAGAIKGEPNSPIPSPPPKQ
jgi:hypothetical protein